MRNVAPEPSDLATVVALVGLGGFAVYWWLKWQTRVAWFDRGLADARSRAHDESREEGGGSDDGH